MAKVRRWITSVAAASGLVVAMGTVPAEAASVSTYSISIHAKNPHFANVTLDTLVFHGNKALQNATISGTVSGATAGDVVTLLAERFRATHFTAVGKHVTLASSTGKYSFSVRPTLATKYEARVTTGSNVDATSKVQSVYVSLIERIVALRKRSTRTEAIETIRVRTYVPASAFGTETHKHWYLYLGVNRSYRTPSKTPPQYLTLSKASTASKAKRISATAYYVTFTFRIPLYGKNVRWFPDACTKDSVTKDGLGLPGHHGCGAKKVRSDASYLG
jgi:hypothetical protein